MILGGFQGNETDVSQRDYVNNHTILSGDINQDDQGSLFKSDNVYTVFWIIGPGADSTTLIDGLFIKKGYADEPLGATSYNFSYRDRDDAGGMNLTGANPIIRNCTFRDNYARKTGGAVYAVHSIAQFENCTFNDNRCLSVGTSFSTGGGAVFMSHPITSSYTTYLRFSNCEFIDNSGGNSGGAIRSQFASFKVDNCLFDDNYAGSGGAIYFFDASGRISNSEFINNSGGNGGAIARNSGTGILSHCNFRNNNGGKGGAIYSTLSGTPVINCQFIENTRGKSGVLYGASDYSTYYNCIFSKNTASSAGPAAGVSFNENYTSTKFVNCSFSQNSASNSIASTGGAAGILYSQDFAHPVVENCILWDNSLPESKHLPYINNFSTATFRNNILQGATSIIWDLSYGVDSGNNISIDPLFLAPNQHYLRVDITSPAIDAGDNILNSTTTDLALVSLVFMAEQ